VEGPQFSGKGRDMARLYVVPPEKALMLCADENPRIQRRLKPPEPQTSRPKLIVKCRAAGQ
jgi:hypothetical protein